jgi:hypothetical protein
VGELGKVKTPKFSGEKAQRAEAARFARVHQKKNPSCCNLQAQDNEPIYPATTPESHGLGPVIPIARVLQQRAG